MTTEQPRPTGVGLRSERGPVLAGVMVATSLVALDATILATAVPAIVEDLGGFARFPWLFSVYLLAMAVTVPIFGKLADMLGRRPVMFVGIGIFVTASVLCGFAWSMPVLIACRALQGIGAGAIQPISVTVIGDMYSVEERARVQGYIASVWGMSSVIGPTLGGVFAEYLSWRGIFFINVPLGAAAAWMFARNFHERVERREHRIDYAGSVLLTTGCSLVILGLLEGGVEWAWRSPTSVAVFGLGLLLLAAFVAVERRAAEPVLPLWLFSRRVLTGGNLASLALGALLIGLTSYVPTYVQGVLGTGALVAGFALAAMTVGWPIAATFSGRLYMRIGFRDTTLVGGSVLVLGTVLCALVLTATAAVWHVAAACFVVGFGLGLVASPVMVAVQSVVGWDRRGVVTATQLFSRSIGSAVGVAVFGAIANATLANRFANAPAAVAEELPSGDVDATSVVLERSGDIPPAVLDFARSALYDAAHHVFLGLSALAVVVVLMLLLMPRRTRPLVFDD